MVASATLLVNRSWVIDPANPTTQVIAGTGGGLGGGGQRITTRTTLGDVRSYASGRRRTVTTANSQDDYAFALIHMTESQADQLDAWRVSGTVLLFRDTYGQRVFGTVFQCTRYYEVRSKIDTTQTNSDSNGPFVDVALDIIAVSMPIGS